MYGDELRNFVGVSDGDLDGGTKNVLEYLIKFLFILRFKVIITT